MTLLPRSRPLAALALAAALGTTLGAGTLVPAGPALADPPAHAPAHGWRKKHDPSYAGYRGHTGYEWDRDYGVRSGRCDTDDVLAAVGAVTGGVIGNRTASDGNRTVATIVGAVIGGVVGHEIGRQIDRRDRACIGHSLELAASGQPVRWQNPDTGVAYTVRPLRDVSSGCRDFELAAAKGGRSGAEKLRACRGDDGAWQVGARA